MLEKSKNGSYNEGAACERQTTPNGNVVIFMEEWI